MDAQHLEVSTRLGCLGVYSAVQQALVADMGQGVDMCADVAAGREQVGGGRTAVGSHPVAVAAVQAVAEHRVVR